MTHCTSANEGLSKRPVPRSDIAAILEASTINDDTGSISRTQELRWRSLMRYASHGCLGARGTSVMRGWLPRPWRPDNIVALHGDRIFRNHARSERDAYGYRPSGCCFSHRHQQPRDPSTK